MGLCGLRIRLELSYYFFFGAKLSCLDLERKAAASCCVRISLLAAASSITKNIRFLSGKLLLLFRAGKKRLSHSEVLAGRA